MKLFRIWPVLVAAAVLPASAQNTPFQITSTSPLPSVDVCVANTSVTCGNYSFTFTSNAGQPGVFATPPVSWSLSSGTSARGTVSLDSTTGILNLASTNSTDVGQQTLDVLAFAGDDGAEQFFTYQINSALVINTLSLPTAQQGVAYSNQMSALNGTAPYTWTADPASLPPGFTLSSTGLLSSAPSGPTLPGVYNIVFHVTDSAGGPTTITETLPLTILAALQQTSPTTLPQAEAGAPYTFTFTAVGGQPSYSWGIPSGSSPPPGLNLDTYSGTLSGTPTAPGTYQFPVSVSDTFGPTDPTVTQNYSLTVVPHVSIGTTSLPPGVLQNAYAGVTLQPQGGIAPFTWVARGLPSGMTLSPGGVLSGNPTAAGTFTVTATVTDSAGTPQSASQQLTLVIRNTGPAITVGPSAGTAGVAYSSTLVAQGGVAPYTWSITAGLLPAGISLNAATGVLSGTATAGGSFPITLQVTDSGTPALSTTQSFSLQLSAPQTTLTVDNVQSPGQAVNANLALGQTTTAALAGTVTLSFQPNAAGVDTGYIDPAVQFVNTGSRTYTFTVPAGAQSIALPQIQPGTVAGTLTATATIGGQTAASTQVAVGRIAPIIDSGGVQITNMTTTSFDVEITGTSTPRDLQSITFTFTAADGAKIAGTTTFTLNVSSQVSAWYASAASQPYGSRLLLTIPFNFTGSEFAIGSVSVALTNSAGTSTAVTGIR